MLNRFRLEDAKLNFGRDPESPQDADGSNEEPSPPKQVMACRNLHIGRVPPLVNVRKWRNIGHRHFVGLLLETHRYARKRTLFDIADS